MSEEAYRALTELKAPRSRKPYYVSYLVRDIDQHYIDARFGTLLTDEHRRTRRCFADVRVGNYRNDHVRDGGLEDNSMKSESYGCSSLPIGNRPNGIRHGLWQLTETRYREAAQDLLEKQAETLHFRDPNGKLPAFEKRKAVEVSNLPRLPEIDRDYWTRFVESASAVGQKYPGIYGCTVELTVRYATRLFVNTEGARIASRHPIWQLNCALDLCNEEGVTIPHNVVHLVTEPGDLPDLRTFKTDIRQAVKQMHTLAKARTLRAYSGPVLLDPTPAGLLMHEALGHRLEGNRLLSRGEGHTFRDALGSEMLPSSLSMYDDPTLREFEGQKLVGAYDFDDEGVAAERVDLVSEGRINGFLSSRAPIDKKHRSNGHARNDSFERPISRMGVTVVEAKDAVDDATLTEKLIEEVKRQGLPFGVHVRRADSGETATKSYDFQAFLGQIRVAELVYTDGKRELVRDVNFVGTPLNAIRGVIAAGSKRQVDNSYCGAESGSVPVTTIAPALLIDDLELQSSARNRNAPYNYPLPWSPAKR